MPKTWVIILLHQLIFQGMFIAKNIILRRRIGKQIRGNNNEATRAILFFVLFIGIAFAISIFNSAVGEVQLLSDSLAMGLGVLFLLAGLLVSGASLIHLKDSWRVGVLEEQKTDLITTGVYQFTRNPYFVSYLLMFLGYAVLLQNLILFGLAAIGFLLIHQMIVKEEIYLQSVHGNAYAQYKNDVPRYL